MRIIGHRGARGLAPENTLASIEKVLQYPVDMIEIDVRTTRDGKAVLSHDEHIKGTHILTTTHRKLKKLDGELTTLEDALKLVPLNMVVNLEVKPHARAAHIVAAIKRSLEQTGRKPEMLLFSSFDFGLLQKLHAKLPDIPVAILERFSGIRAAHRARKLGVKRLHFSAHALWSLYIRAATSRGYEVYAYTINKPEKAAKWKRYGLAGIFTDYPDRFLKKK